MTTLRDPRLRIRDMRRILSHKRSRVVWEPGSSAGSEWVYATLEDEPHRERLLQWLASKDVPDSAEAFVFVVGHYECSSTTWGEVRSHPERFFAGRPIQIISKDTDWRLDYRESCVARFGHWA